MQKITPYLWFNNNATEAIEFYINAFGDAKVKEVQEYPEGAPGLEGGFISATLEIYGEEFIFLNAGPDFSFTPAISFFVFANSVEEVNQLWSKLSDGGSVLMELGQYPFSELYGWCSDKFGVSWQVFLGDSKQRITPNLMYVGQQAGMAEEAMNFYVSLFENSKIGEISRYPAGGIDKEGTVMYGEFTLAGKEFTAMDSALEHAFSFTEAISLYVNCADQSEVDRLWNAFIAHGGEESMCGWLKDKYGVSWQIIPTALNDYLTHSDPIKAQKAMQAMLQMRKIDVAELERAVNN